MTFKPATWYPIAAILSVLNVVAAGYAAASTEPVHAGTHAALALAFGLWAQSLRQRRKQELRDTSRDELHEPAEGLAALEAQVQRMRQELTETQERLDFAERMLTQQRNASESKRLGPQD
jgi:flagellar motility protein MotE (MotC chaperone)